MLRSIMPSKCYIANRNGITKPATDQVREADMSSNPSRNAKDSKTNVRSGLPPAQVDGYVIRPAYAITKRPPIPAPITQDRRHAFVCKLPTNHLVMKPR